MVIDNIVWQPSKITRNERNKLNAHKSCVIWFTGLSASGKSTIAFELEKRLIQNQIRSYVLDGDNIRHGLNNNLGFSPDDRSENIRRIGEVSKLFVDAGILVVTAFISPYRNDRDMARSLFEQSDFIEVYIKCDITECERRDPKGLYKKARAGEISNFTGISDPYEEPLNPEIIIESDGMTISEATDYIIQYLENQINLRDVMA